MQMTDRSLILSAQFRNYLATGRRICHRSSRRGERVLSPRLGRPVVIRLAGRCITTICTPVHRHVRSSAIAAELAGFRPLHTFSCHVSICNTRKSSFGAVPRIGREPGVYGIDGGTCRKSAHDGRRRPAVPSRLLPRACLTIRLGIHLFWGSLARRVLGRSGTAAAFANSLHW